MSQSICGKSCSQRGRNQIEIYADLLVEDLDISNALARRLVGQGVITVGQLLTMCVDDLARFYWVGKGSIREIQEAVMALGLEPLGEHAPRQKIKKIV